MSIARLLVERRLRAVVASVSLISAHLPGYLPNAYAARRSSSYYITVDITISRHPFKASGCGCIDNLGVICDVEAPHIDKHCIARDRMILTIIKQNDDIETQQYY